MSQVHPVHVAPATAPLRVLVVEDNDVNRKVVTRMLERLGCQVDIAVDGEEGVQKAAAGTYAVIFMDCSMPRMDGYEASQQIRKLPPPYCRVPILALTAHATPADRTRCLAAGMDLWLPKPISTDDLAGAIERYAGWRGTVAAPEVHLDQGTVDQLLGLDDPEDPDFLGELVQQFRTTGEQAVDESRRLLSAGRYEDLRAVAARLRSSATAVGAIRVVGGCERIQGGDDAVLAERASEWIQHLAKQLLKAVVALTAVVEKHRG